MLKGSLHFSWYVKQVEYVIKCCKFLNIGYLIIEQLGIHVSILAHTIASHINPNMCYGDVGFVIKAKWINARDISVFDGESSCRGQTFPPLFY